MVYCSLSYYIMLYYIIVSRRIASPTRLCSGHTASHGELDRSFTIITLIMIIIIMLLLLTIIKPIMIILITMQMRTIALTIIIVSTIITALTIMVALGPRGLLRGGAAEAEDRLMDATI